jgi:3-isopropylmalate dehydrogenase
VGTFSIAVLSGDGIGPEVVEQAVRVLHSAGRRFTHTFHLTHALVGVAAIEAEGEAISDATMQLCHDSDAILFGAVALFRLRKELELYANLRPIKPFQSLLNASTIKREVLEGTDLLVVRELTGGLYFGKPSEIRENAQGLEAIDTLFYTESEITRIVRTACELAQGRQKKVTSVDKANVLSSSRLWRRVAERVASEYPDITLEHQLVDSCAMQLIRWPRQFDVVVTENMFGDILTDEASMLAGSLGMLPSASLGTRHTAHGRFGLYEPIHGTAPDITGQDKANPIAAILTTALLLRYSLQLSSEADAIEAAVERVIANGYRTPDVGEEGKIMVGTREMGRLIAETLEH